MLTIEQDMVRWSFTDLVAEVEKAGGTVKRLTKTDLPFEFRIYRLDLPEWAESWVGDYQEITTFWNNWTGLMEYGWSSQGFADDEVAKAYHYLKDRDDVDKQIIDRLHDDYMASQSVYAGMLLWLDYYERWPRVEYKGSDENCYIPTEPEDTRPETGRYADAVNPVLFLGER